MRFYVSLSQHGRYLSHYFETGTRRTKKYEPLDRDVWYEASGYEMEAVARMKGAASLDQ
jgi:hypothetical protein